MNNSSRTVQCNLLINRNLYITNFQYIPTSFQDRSNNETNHNASNQQTPTPHQNAKAAFRLTNLMNHIERKRKMARRSILEVQNDKNDSQISQVKHRLFIQQLISVLLLLVVLFSNRKAIVSILFSV